MAHAKEILAPILMRRRSNGVLTIEQIKAKVGDTSASADVSFLRSTPYWRNAPDHVSEARA